MNRTGCSRSPTLRFIKSKNASDEFIKNLTEIKQSEVITNDILNIHRYGIISFELFGRPLLYIDSASVNENQPLLRNISILWNIYVHELLLKSDDLLKKFQEDKKIKINSSLESRINEHSKPAEITGIVT